MRCQVGYMLQEHTFSESTSYLVKDVIIMGRFGRIGLFRKPNETDRSAVRKKAEGAMVAICLVTGHSASTASKLSIL